MVDVLLEIRKPLVTPNNLKSFRFSETLGWLNTLRGMSTWFTSYDTNSMLKHVYWTLQPPVCILSKNSVQNCSKKVGMNPISPDIQLWNFVLISGTDLGPLNLLMAHSTFSGLDVEGFPSCRISKDLLWENAIAEKLHDKAVETTNDRDSAPGIEVENHGKRNMATNGERHSWLVELHIYGMKSYPVIKGSLDEKLLSYEVLKMLRE